MWKQKKKTKSYLEVQIKVGGKVHLLLTTTPDQQNSLARFSKLACLHGHRVSVYSGYPLTLSEVVTKAKASAVDAILCSNQIILEKTLHSLHDFREPLTKKQLSLDDYQGSLLDCRGIPMVVLNPPEQIMTVPYGSYIFSRFIQKVTKPAEWFPQTKFVWSVATPESVENDFNSFRSNARLLAVDIETPRSNPTKTISCISFTAWFPETHTTNSIVFPFDSLWALAWIRKFAALPQPKVLQGGTYDVIYLLRFNIPLYNWLYDTLNLFHSYYSELPKRLDFVAAFALRDIRYWKDDGKTGNLEDYFRYNALDGWATINSCLSLMLELPEWAIRNYLEEFPINFPAVHCELEGWKVDQERFVIAKEKATREHAQKLSNLRKMLKAPNYNPNSWQQNKKVFAILGCGDLPTTGEKDMLKAEYRHPLNARVLGDVRAYKAGTKELGNYMDERKFWNWRLFYRLNPAGTDTGRMSSSESSFWVGYQIQNIPVGEEVKQYLVADPGWKLAEPDASQSEARCVFYMAGEEKGIELVESGKDYHSWNIQAFFGIKYEEVWDTSTGKSKNKDIRDLSKRTNHGANYNMTAGVLLDTMGPRNVAKAKVLLKLPTHWTLKQVCQFLLQRYSATYPKVKGLWYEQIINSIELTKKLVSPLGWTRHFFGDPRNNKHHLNAAVAHGPQNLSVTIINRGLYRLWWEILYGCLHGNVRLKAQIHDSAPFQYRETPGRDSRFILEKVKELMTIPVDVKGADGVTRKLVIPIAMSAGKERWSELK